MSKGMAIGVVIIETFLVLGIAGAAGRNPAESSADTRQRVVLSQIEREQVLAEMRQMLESVSGILRGYVANDLSAIEKAARPSGMAMAVDPQLRKKLPVAFLQLGMQTHRGFEKLADQAAARGTREEAITTLATLSGNCAACHATYRLDETR